MMNKKIEFSKVILATAGIATAIVVVFTFLIVWKTNDTTPLAYLIPAIFAELATATGFYYSKAKRENEIKLRKAYGKKIYEETKQNDYSTEDLNNDY